MPIGDIGWRLQRVRKAGTKQTFFPIDSPSRADIQMTQAIVDVAKPLGIAVHDHIIIGKDGHVSMKGMKLI